MEVLKQITAVPLFATAIWLAWVYGSLFVTGGIDHVAWLLACFLALAIAGWTLGRWPAKWGSAIAAVLLIAAGLTLTLRQPKPEVETWQPYTTASLEQARASGHAVFVDFTAAWCLSCKVNEAAVLKSEEVKKKFADSNVVLLKADWTAHDDFITQQLAALGRSGVPTYVIYPPGKTTNADVLPELLTKNIVLNALEKDLKLATH
jgi:thiol:disulfide interchange protein DsbD